MTIRNLKDLVNTLQIDFAENIFLKSKIIILMFRLANYLACRSRLTILIGLPYFVFYKFWLEWVLGLEIPIRTNIGKGFVIYHGFGIVINGSSTIGEYCKIRQGVTIGNKLLRNGEHSSPPIIGDRVEFGANASVIGPVHVGDDAVIAAGAVVVKDVLAGQTVGGVPAVPLRG